VQGDDHVQRDQPVADPAPEVSARHGHPTFPPPPTTARRELWPEHRPSGTKGRPPAGPASSRVDGKPAAGHAALVDPAAPPQPDTQALPVQTGPEAVVALHAHV